MAALNKLLLAVASVGFAAQAIVHIAALSGFTAPFQQLEKLLIPALFVIFVPTILIMNRMTRDFKQRDIWKAALRGCPKWMRVALWTIAGYAWLAALSPLLFGSRNLSPLASARCASAMILAFYAISVGVLYSSTQVAKVDVVRRCLNGHPVGPAASFCEQCGAPVALGAANPVQST
jgi:hypothetical protein